jgi:hypothetical protein
LGSSWNLFLRTFIGWGNCLNPEGSEKITRKLYSPSNANQMHHIRSKRWPLLMAKAPLDLILNEIHHIKLQTRASILMSEN